MNRIYLPVVMTVFVLGCAAWHQVSAQTSVKADNSAVNTSFVRTGFVKGRQPSKRLSTMFTTATSQVAMLHLKWTVDHGRLTIDH